MPPSWRASCSASPAICRAVRGCPSSPSPAPPPTPPPIPASPHPPTDQTGCLQIGWKSLVNGLRSPDSCPLFRHWTRKTLVVGICCEKDAGAKGREWSCMMECRHRWAADQCRDAGECGVRGWLGWCWRARDVPGRTPNRHPAAVVALARAAAAAAGVVAVIGESIRKVSEFLDLAFAIYCPLS